ncbi:hypothetical protein STFE110948_02410 [Streptobacillus felis]|uniref:hypothetical protein n=1 Tax=Streptobacillus felis TaxID=1384509 RepID=UPI00082F46A8|nr:hypothetical protein [Streptobacillus felis]
MERFDEIIIDFDMPKHIKEQIDELDELYDKYGGENSKKYSKEEITQAEIKFFEIIGWLEVDVRSAYRNGLISVDDGYKILDKYLSF